MFDKSKAKKIIISCSSSLSLIHFRGELIQELIKNHQVIVFTPQITEQKTRSQLFKMGVKVYEHELKGNSVSVLADLKYILKLIKVIKFEKPDIFFSYTFKPVIYGSIVASLCRVKGITAMLSGLGYTFMDDDSRNTLVKKITRNLLKFSLKFNKKINIIFQNSDDCEKLINDGIIDQNNQTYIVNGSGVDLSHYEFSKPVQNSISFLMIARLINAKGIEDYYKAAQIIRSKYPEVRFKLVGPYRSDSIDSIDENLYSKIKSGETIDYYGNTLDVRPFIRESSVVVLPSFYGEGVPRCILEAMAMGRAIITTNSSGCKPTVNTSPNMSNGFLIPMRDVSALVSKMEYYINHPNDIIEYGMNGRKLAEEKFDVHKVNKQMLEILS